MASEMKSLSGGAYIKQKMDESCTFTEWSWFTKIWFAYNESSLQCT
jgi:hypothetical protein